MEVNYTINIDKKVLSYEQGIKLLKKELLKVKKDRNLNAFCRKHNLTYNFISGFINDKRPAPIPKLAQKLFLAFGLKMVVKTTIEFEITTDN